MKKLGKKNTGPSDRGIYLHFKDNDYFNHSSIPGDIIRTHYLSVNEVAFTRSECEDVLEFGYRHILSSNMFSEKFKPEAND